MMKSAMEEENTNFLSINNNPYQRRHSDLPPRPKLDLCNKSEKNEIVKSGNIFKKGIYISNDSGSRRSAARRVTDGGQTAGLLLHNYTRRRGSFLYRSDSDVENSTRSSRNQSLTGDESSIGRSDEMIITPFAQILSSLKKVRANFMLLANITGIKRNNDNIPEDKRYYSLDKSKDIDDLQNVSFDTLEELEWCLSQLETIQTSQSVSSLANLKFRRILSRELTEDKESTNKEVTDYIFKTFLKDEDSYLLTNRHKLLSNLKFNNFSNDHFALSLSLNLEQNKIVYKFLEINKYEWNMDLFLLNEITHDQPLAFVSYHIFQKLNLFTKFSINIETFVRLMNKVEESYSNKISYHNSIHAADVTHTTFVLLSTTALKDVFTDLEIMAILIASSVHDIDHPGVTNQFLINTNNKLALIYNDISILENHHLAVAFKLFNEEKYSAFSSLQKKEMLSFRRLIIDMVIATDMSKHMCLLADLKTLVETRKVSGSSVLSMDNYSERVQVLQVMIHCSDLSNPTKSLVIYENWVSRIMEEFFQQGDKEKKLNIDISPMCDRETANIAMSQVSFIDYIVHPLWETWADLVYPDHQFILDTLEENRKHFQDKAILQGS